MSIALQLYINLIEAKDDNTRARLIAEAFDALEKRLTQLAAQTTSPPEQGPVLAAAQEKTTHHSPKTASERASVDIDDAERRWNNQPRAVATSQRGQSDDRTHRRPERGLTDKDRPTGQGFSSTLAKRQPTDSLVMGGLPSRRIRARRHARWSVSRQKSHQSCTPNELNAVGRISDSASAEGLAGSARHLSSRPQRDGVTAPTRGSSAIPARSAKRLTEHRSPRP
jgi:hypothetical protein